MVNPRKYKFLHWWQIELLFSIFFATNFFRNCLYLQLQGLQKQKGKTKTKKEKRKTKNEK